MDKHKKKKEQQGKAKELQKKVSVNTYEVLTEAGYKPAQSLVYRKVLATSEQGRKYTLEISEQKETALFDVDGYILTQGQKCDKLILVNGQPKNNDEEWCEIFIELKGKDVGHAIDQLRATLKNPIFKHPSNKVVKARIVAASFPANKSNPIMEKAKKEFAASPYYCELRGMKNGQKDKI